MKKALSGIVAVSLLIMIVHSQLMKHEVKITNSGTIKSLGLIVDVDHIDWGKIAPNSLKTRIIQVSPNGTEAVTLLINTTSWNPQNASDFLFLSSNYTGETLFPGQWAPVELTLSVRESVSGITSFSFDIILTAVEKEV